MELALDYTQWQALVLVMLNLQILLPASWLMELLFSGNDCYISV